MKIKAIILILILTVSQGLCADKLTVALRNDLPPLSFMGVDKQPAGFFVDIWKLWAEKTGREVSFRIGARQDNLDSLKNATADIVGALAITEERSQWIAFSPPIYEISHYLFFPKNKIKIKSIQELKGEKIGVSGGTIPEQELRKKYPDIELVRFKTIEDKIHAVREGKIRAFVSTAISVSMILNKMGLVGEFESADDAVIAGKLHAGVLKENKNLIALVEKGFDAISDHELAEIEARWIPDPAKRYYKTDTKQIHLTAEEETWLKTHKTIRVGMSPVFPPLKFSEKDEIKGVEPDYLNLFSELTGIHFEYVICPFTEMDSKVKSGEIDMFISFHIPERLPYMTFTKPFMDFRHVIITRNDAPFMSGISALTGKKVAIVKGVKLYKKILAPYPDIETVEVNSMEEMFKAVSGFKADALVSKTLFAGYSIENYPNLKIAGVADLPPEPYLYAVRKDYPELISILNKAISSITKEQHDAIFQKWSRVNIEYRPNWSEILKWAFVIGSFFIIILGMTLLWNRRLSREITERKRAEESLCESEEQYRDLVENLSDALFKTDIKGLVIYISPIVETIIGFKPEEIIGKHFSGFFHPDDLPLIVERFQKRISGEDSEPAEIRSFHKSGKVIWIRSSSSQYVRNGVISGVQGVLTDITIRKEAEEALRESEEQFRRMFEYHHAVMMLVDPETGKIIRANQSAQKYYGYTAKEFETLTIYQINQLSKEEIASELADAYADKRNYFHFPHRLASGEIRDVEVHSSPIPFKGKELLFSVIHDITDRKRTEEALRQSEAKYRRLFEDAAIGIFHSTFEGRFIDVNPALARMLGYDSPDEVINAIHSISDQIYTEPRHRTEVIADMLTKGGTVIAENRYLRKDGSVWIGNLILRCLMDEQGQPKFMEGFVEDITERKRAEEALRESEERIRRITDTVPGMLYDYILYPDGSSRLLYVSEHCYDIIETQPEIILQDINVFWNMVHPDDIQRLYHEDKEANRRGDYFISEVRIITPSGKLKWIEFRSKPNPAESGEPAVWSGIIIDITQRKQAEEALRENEERYRKAQALGHVGNWEYNIQTTRFWGSDEAKRIYGFDLSADNFTTDEVENCIPERERVHQALVDLIEKDKEYNLEFDIITKGKNERRTIISLAELEKDETGRPLKITGVIRDITERKQFEEKRLELERQILNVKKIESLGRVTAGIAHNFNNILYAVTGNIEIAMDDIPPKSSTREILDEAFKAANRAADLTHKILAYSGSGFFKFRKVDVSNLIKENTDAFKSVISETVSFSVNLTEDIPLIKADPEQIQRVITNILVNACEAIGESAGTVILSTGISNCCDDSVNNGLQRIDDPEEKPVAELCELCVYIEISDTGCGMNEESVKLLFDPFFTTKFMGRGLGMSEVQGIVRNHNGGILVKSEPGQGTTIRVLFPVSESVPKTKEHKQGSF
jgi:PAS domain S-box-containing protein